KRQRSSRGPLRHPDRAAQKLVGKGQHFALKGGVIAYPRETLIVGALFIGVAFHQPALVFGRRWAGNLQEYPPPLGRVAIQQIVGGPALDNRGQGVAEKVAVEQPGGQAKPT